ncbi:MAG TPA: hypothetical protein VLG76_08740 [Rhabdochlamydiaceae bacterium]|nr:hypothetical protein [Rhabdochlamydiaceae bacterium]
MAAPLHNAQSPQGQQQVEAKGPAHASRLATLNTRLATYNTQFVNWVRNPANERNRNVAQEFLVGLTVLVVTVAAVVVPVLGWAALYNIAKEYNRQVADFKQRLVSTIAAREAATAKVRELQGALQDATREATSAAEAHGRSRTGIESTDQAFRREIERIANLKHGKGQALRAALDNSDFKVPVGTG